MFIKSSFYTYLKQQLFYLFYNHFITHIPLLFFRMFLLRLSGAKIGKRTIIDIGWYVMGQQKLKIGPQCHINRNCMLDARGGLTIGNNVSVSHNVCFVTGSHDYNTPDFKYVDGPIIVDDNVWIGLNVTILKNVHIGEGAVVAAGALVTKDIPPFEVWGGVPAKKIGERTCHEIQYNCTRFVYKGKLRKPYFC